MRREFAESWLRLSRDSTAFLALILLVVTSISTLIIATMLPKFALQVLDIAPENIVFVLAPVGIAIFLGLRSVEYLADRFNKLVTISAAYVLMAASLIALGLVPRQRRAAARRSTRRRVQLRTCWASRARASSRRSCTPTATASR